MPENYEEKVFFNENSIKVTDLRLTCNHVTVPVNRIEHYSINFRVNNLLVSFTVFILSLIGVYILVRLFSNWGYLGFVGVVLCFVWLRMEYSRYVELFITTGGRKIKMLDAPMNNRENVFKTADALSEALLELQRQKEQSSGKNPVQPFSASDTMKLKKIIMDYDKR